MSSLTLISTCFKSQFSNPVRKGVLKPLPFSLSLSKYKQSVLQQNKAEYYLCNSYKSHINSFKLETSITQVSGREWTHKDLIYLSVILSLHTACLYAPFCFSWDAFGVFVILYITTGLFGITLSYHRNLSHKSFELPKWLEYTFAYCGVQALQADPITWVSTHRYHHQYSDTLKDAHSPLQGFWHSHVGWLLNKKSFHDKFGERKNVNDLARDPFYIFIAKTYALHPLMLACLLYNMGGIPYIVWGMAFRTVWVYHMTWAVNSASHIWGSQEWDTGDLSRNNWWVALLAFGEGWHNNHHAFEYSARHGLQWWQLDMTWLVINLLQSIGLASKVKLPNEEHKKKLKLL